MNRYLFALEMFFVIIVFSIGCRMENIEANEFGTMGHIKMIYCGQVDYKVNSNPHTYAGSLTCLGSGNGAGGTGFIQPDLAKEGKRSGYIFELHYTKGSSAEKPEGFWSATAWPITYKKTGIRTFFIDDSGVLRGGDINGAKGTASLPIINIK